MGWNAFFCCSQFDIVKKDDILSAANILKHCQNEVRSKLLILTTNRTYVCQSQLFLLALLSALRPVETSSCLAPDDGRPGNRAFCVAGPAAWNSLPPDIRTASTLSTFKNRLKTHLFLHSILRTMLYKGVPCICRFWCHVCISCTILHDLT